ncbi:MAG: hypothetical protein K8S23_10295 [Candidatus Cloacimonetes bacterium]|nr:hypothetical protein [Candidatus Cloacimonadota bacterium]
MKLFKIMAVIGVVIFLLTGCGKPDPSNDVEKVYYPDWWDLQGDPSYVQTYGIGEKVSENSSYDAAQSNAMLAAAQYVESHVKGMVKNYEEEVGVDNPTVTALTSKVVKNVSNATFTKVMVTKREVTIIKDDNGTKKYKTYVRVSIPKDTVNENLVNQIKKEEALYNSFKASQAFKELEHELNQ